MASLNLDDYSILNMLEQFQRDHGTQAMIKHNRGLDKRMHGLVDRLLVAGIRNSYPLGLVLQIHKNMESFRPITTERIDAEVVSDDVYRAIHYHQYITESFGYNDAVVSRLTLKLGDFLVSEFNLIFGSSGITSITIADQELPLPLTPNGLSPRIMSSIRNMILLCYLANLFDDAEEEVVVELEEHHRRTSWTKIDDQTVHRVVETVHGRSAAVILEANNQNIFDDMYQHIDDGAVILNMSTYSRSGSHNSYLDFTHYPTY